MSSPEFTEFQLLQAVHHAFQLPENAPQVRSKPRASGLTSDAREVAYSMANVPKSNPHSEQPDRVDMAFTQEQGRLAEEITIGALAQLGWPVTDRQIELPADYFVTGHPDGIIGYHTLFEHKLYGRFAYKDLARDGIWGSKGRDILAQAALYGDALGLDDVLIVVASQDASSIRLEFRQAAFRNKGINPKVQLFRVDMADLRPLIPQLKARAEFFIDWMATDGDPSHVAWEHDPNRDAFPWSYSEWRSRAIADGPSDQLVAPPAFQW